jgi:hypothetical protein
MRGAGALCAHLIEIFIDEHLLLLAQKGVVVQDAVHDDLGGLF